MKRLHLLHLAPIFVVLMSCQTLPSDLPDYDELLKVSTEQDGRVCIRSDRINGFGTLGSNVVSVDTLGRNYYLLTTALQCNSLDVSVQVAFPGKFAEFCPLRDRIITRDEACMVKSIFEFDSREDAFAAFNKAEEKRNVLIEEFRKKQVESE